MLDYNPFNHAIVDDCYAVYRRLRDEAPAFYNAELDFYALSRYRDVLDAHLDPATFSSRMGATIEGIDAGQPFLIVKDPPEHTWHRRIVGRVFTPRRIGGLEPLIRATAARYLDPHVGTDGFDVVTDFSFRLPLDVIGGLLDIPTEYREEVHVKSDLLAAMAGRSAPMPRSTRASN